MGPGRFSSPKGPWSFAAGSGTLPAAVLAEARAGLGTRSVGNLSVLELPFSTAEFRRIQEKAEADLRALLALPQAYRILFLQGGATAQFAFLPVNLAGADASAVYVESGLWSRRAAAAAEPLIAVTRSPSGSEPGFARGAAYCHVTTTETAEGWRLPSLPAIADETPLVADMTGDLCARDLPIGRFGLVYASAQKNLGIAGLTVAIVREDLLGRARPGTPAPFNYTLQAREHSRVNTPPVAAIYVAGLVLKWLRENGGVGAMARRHARRSAKLYALLDRSDLYACPTEPACRSEISVCFRLPTAEIEAAFLDGAVRRGLLHLKGHPAIGGIRACLYNGLPDEAVDALAEYLAEFARRPVARLADAARQELPARPA